jgi:hypothetical protein
MNEIQTSFVVVGVIFAISTLITFFTWIYYVIKGYHLVSCEIEHEARETTVHEHHALKIHWLRSIWIYPCLIASLFIFTVYYITAALGAGTIPTATSNILLWSRWLVVGLVGIINHIMLAFLFTHHVGDYKGNEVNKHGGLTSHFQSLWCILWYFIAVIIMFAATLSDVNGVKVSRIIFSAISFTLSIFFYFFPFNKLMFVKDGDYDDIFFVQTHKKLTIKEKTNRHSIILFYRWTTILSIVLAFIIYYIIWILSESNGLTSVLGLDSEVYAYEVADCILTIPTTILLIIFSIVYKQKTVQVKNLKHRSMVFGSSSSTTMTGI